MDFENRNAALQDFGGLLTMCRTFIPNRPKSQIEIGLRAGLSIAQIRAFESGEELPCDAQLCRLARALSIDLGFLLGKARNLRTKSVQPEDQRALGASAGRI